MELKLRGGGTLTSDDKSNSDGFAEIKLGGSDTLVGIELAISATSVGIRRVETGRGRHFNR